MAQNQLNVRLGLDTKAFAKALRGAERSINQVARRFENVGRDLSSAITLPIALIGGTAFKTAADFEQAMNKVRAISGDISDNAFAKLEATARRMGANTAFSATEAAEGLAFLAQAGFSVEQQIGAIEPTLNLAAAGGISLAEAADIASNVMSGFGATTTELTDIIDVMAKQFTSSNTDVLQLGNAFSFVAPVAAAFGVSVRETSAAIGILSDAGIQGERAGTALRGILTKLSSEADKLGVNTKNAQGGLRPLADILADIEEKGLSADQAMAIFGDRAGPGLLALIERGSEGLRTQLGLLEDVGGTAQQVAEQQLEGFNGSLRILRSRIEDLFITIAQSGPLESVTGLVQRASDAVGRLSDGFSQLRPELQSGILQFLGIAAAIGPVLFAIGKLVRVFGLIPAVLSTILPLLSPLISGLTLASRALFAATLGGQGLTGALAVLNGTLLATIAPFVAIAAAIAGVTAAVLFVRRNMEAFAPFFQNVWNLIQRGVRAAIGPMLFVIRAIGTGLLGLSEEAASFSNFFRGLWDGIKRTVVSALSAITNGLRRLAELVGIDTSKLESFSEFIAGVKEDAVELVTGLTAAEREAKRLGASLEGEGGAGINTASIQDEMAALAASAELAATGIRNVDSAAKAVDSNQVDALSEATSNLSLNFAALTQAAESALTANLGENAFVGLRAGAGQAELELSNLREQFRQFDEVAAAFGQTEGAQNQLDLLRQKIEATRDAIKTAAVEFGASTEPVQVLQGELGTLTEQYTALGAELDLQAEKQTALAAVIDNVTQQVTQGLNQAFGDFFTTLVEGGKDAFGSFTRALGQMVKKIVVDLLKAIATALVLTAILSFLPGGGSASFLSSFAGLLGGGGRGFLQGLPGAAQGGIVPDGYRNDTYLARLTSQEAIIPLDRLQAMIDQPSGQMVAETVIRGEDIYLSYNRTDKNRGR